MWRWIGDVGCISQICNKFCIGWMDILLPDSMDHHLDRQQNRGKVGKQEMKDKQIKEVMGSIENRIRHIYNCGYQQGYEDGKKDQKELNDSISNDAYNRGYEDGKGKLVEWLLHDQEVAELEQYEQGLEDAWQCVRKIGRLDVNEQKAIFGTYTTRQIAIEFTVKEAMKKIKDYESTIAYHDDFATALEKMHKYEEQQKLKKGGKTE